MNVFDYFFENSKELNKKFVLGNQDNMSFSELFTKSEKVASFLQDNSKPGDCIILISANSTFFLMAYLGILKSGRVCVPIDPTIEQNNLNYINEITKSRIIFCNKKLKNRLKFDEDLFRIDEDLLNGILTNQKPSSAFKLIKGSELAEIIFTSGSTGRPKGVMISHANIIANTNSIIDYLKLSNIDVICVVLPFYYCYGLSLLHTHLRVGGSIVLNNSFMFLNTVLADLKNYECSGFAGVPSHFQLLLKKAPTFKQMELPFLRYVTQAGGKLHNIFIEEFVESFPEINFFTMYGQTEATARLTYLSPDLVLRKLGSIGKSIPGVNIKIIDKEGNESGIGKTGQIVAKGDNIMLGYFKDKETSKQYLKNGWLYTGDLAYKDEEGYIYIVAREKEIIKVGGKRISPKEIEGVIIAVSGVVDCTVSGVNDSILGEAIKAKVIIKKEFDLEKMERKILIECRKSLALFKVPSLIEFTEKLSLKATGKKK